MRGGGGGCEVYAPLSNGRCAAPAGFYFDESLQDIAALRGPGSAPPPQHPKPLPYPQPPAQVRPGRGHAHRGAAKRRDACCKSRGLIHHQQPPPNCPETLGVFIYPIHTCPICVRPMHVFLASVQQACLHAGCAYHACGAHGLRVCNVHAECVQGLIYIQLPTCTHRFRPRKEFPAPSVQDTCREMLSVPLRVWKGETPSVKMRCPQPLPCLGGGKFGDLFTQ